jgi:predicted DNA-binding transcriptional regulator YafY
MEELVKKWLPHMRVIEPLSLKRKIEDDLKRYLTANQ